MPFGEENENDYCDLDLFFTSFLTATSEWVGGRENKTAAKARNINLHLTKAEFRQ